MVDNDNEILLTEDGAPIGQVLMTSGDTTPDLGVNERALAAATRELARGNADALAAGADIDGEALVQLFEGFDDDDKRNRALSLYVRDGKSLDETAKAVGVPSRTVAQWMYLGGWDKIVRREIAARQAESVLALAKLRAERRLGVTKEQLEQAKEIRDLAAEKIRDNSVSLKSGTEAWAAASRIEQTLTGVSEAGAIANIDGEAEAKEKDGGKAPLVVVFNGAGGLPPIRKAGTVS